jgi:integrase
MPKLPQGMFKRGLSFYVRIRRRGGDRWRSLGKDYESACRKLRAIRLGAVHTDAKRLWDTDQSANEQKNGSKEKSENESISVKEAVEEYLNSYVATHRNEYGVKQSTSRCRRYVIPFLGEHPLAKVTKNDLRAFRLWLERQRVRKAGVRNLCPQTVRHLLSEARCLFNWAADTDLIERSPVPRKLLPRVQERAPDRLWEEEVAAVTAIPEPYGFVIRLALGSGMRWGELTRVEAKDAHDGILTIHHRTKSSKLRRVPLPAALADELRNRVGRLNPFTNSDHFNRAVRLRSGIERFHVHQCRHTFACTWLERGGSLAALQQQLGHASITTTMQYARLQDAAVFAEARRITVVPQTEPEKTVANAVAGDRAATHAAQGGDASTRDA